MLSRYFRNPQGFLEPAAALTGRSAAEISVGQMHTWLTTSLYPPTKARSDKSWSYIIGGAVTGVCPECIVERPWAVKASWRLRLLPACSKHYLLLIHKCPKCGEAPRSQTGTEGISIEFFSQGCDYCQHSSLPRIPVTEDLIESVARVSNQLHLEAHGLDGDLTQRLDLAAVRDLSHVLLPHLFPEDVYVRGNARLRTTSTIAKTLPLALALLDGSESPSLLATTPERIRLHYYSGHIGQHRPAVLALINQTRPTRNTFKISQKPQHDCIIPWPERLDMALVPHTLTDHLHDAARNLGWDPMIENVERWAALLTAHCRLQARGGINQDKPGTRAETAALQQLLESAAALGIDDGLLKSAEATAEALARRWTIATRSGRVMNDERAG